MDKEIPTIALVMITILAVFVILQPMIPSNSEKFSELGVLGADRTIGGYPTLVTPSNNSFTLYGFIGNHQDSVEYYQYVTKLGNSRTIISNTTSANAAVLDTHSYVLDD